MPKGIRGSTPTCKVDGCSTLAANRGLCQMHARRLRLHGSLDGRKVPSLEERFWAKVDKSGECWLWTARCYPNGYGQFEARLAHRVAYELVVGPIPEGLTLDHVKARGCTHRNCVNPAHLEPVTMRVNNLRGDSLSARNARKTHCPRGHPYDYVNSEGSRRCRICDREANRRASAKRPKNPRQRKTHCPQGHPYDEANTHLYRGYLQQCRACGREKWARRKAKRADTRYEREWAAERRERR